MPPRPACCRAVPARCRRRMRPKRGRPASPGAPVCARLGAGVARQERCGSDADGGNHERATGTPSDLAGPRSGGAWRGRPLRVAGAGAGRAPGAVVGRHRGAEAERAEKRLRLPHAHLRQPLPDRAERDLEAGRRQDRRLPAPAEAHRHDAQRRSAALDLRHRQFLHAGRHGEDRADGARRRRRRHERDRRRAQAPARSRRARHPLQPGAGRRDDGRHARAAVEARRRPRLARADPHARRPDRRHREHPQPPAVADRVRPHGAHPEGRRRRRTRPTPSSAG